MQNCGTRSRKSDLELRDTKERERTRKPLAQRDQTKSEENVVNQTDDCILDIMTHKK